MNISKEMKDGNVSFAISDMNMIEYATLVMCVVCYTKGSERNEITLRAEHLLQQMTHFEKANPKILNERGGINGKEN